MRYSDKDYKISIVGAGYVGLSLACLFSQLYSTVIFDIVEEKINKIKNRISPIQDEGIINYLSKSKRIPKATNNFKDVLKSDFVIIATPTNYDEKTNQFDCSSIIETIEKLKNSKCTIVIKSTVPVGFTDDLRFKYDTDRILFSPEFLREGSALYDNLHPSRVVVSDGNMAEEFASSLIRCAEEDNVKCIICGTKEAESIKLFSNTYLAMRVAFFNELDSFAMKNNLFSKDIIDGLCSDKRIGEGYNNPSFGYGGYCLPKDTKQLKYHYSDIMNNNLINAVVDSNHDRKLEIVAEIKKKIKFDTSKTIGVYRLIMKSNSDNCRQSSTLDIAKYLRAGGCNVIIYEPLVEDIEGITICNNLEEFKSKCDLIITNRLDRNMSDVMDKVFTRDVFGEN